MADINGCYLPEDLYYLVEKHVWARYDDGTVIVGLTDVAQNMAKTIISVTSKGAGKPIKRGKSIATVESGKWVGPVPSPVEGELVEVNTELSSSPSLLNSDPYGNGWIAKVSPDNWDEDVAFLASGPEALDAYRAFLDSQGISCHKE